MLIVTSPLYDMSKFEPVGIVNGVSVHAISYIRDIASQLTSLVGGRQELIEKKFLDVREEAINELKKEAEKMSLDMVVSLEVEMTELGKNFVIFTATGTGLRKKGARGGARGVRAKKGTKKKESKK